MTTTAGLLGSYAGEMTAPVPVTDSMEAILDLLRAGGGRITTSRRLVVSALLGLRGHVTVEELCDLVQASAPDVVISTIYRNLEELERLGVVVHSHLGAWAGRLPSHLGRLRPSGL